MAKVLIAELEGLVLDWAVTKCEEPIGGYKRWVQADLDNGILHGGHYSTDWLWGGEIIEREMITADWTGSPMQGGVCRATIHGKEGANFGPTPLVAAMRRYVASKHKEAFIEVPDQLVNAEMQAERPRG